MPVNVLNDAYEHLIETLIVVKIIDDWNDFS